VEVDLSKFDAPKEPCPTVEDPRACLRRVAEARAKAAAEPQPVEVLTPYQKEQKARRELEAARLDFEGHYLECREPCDMSLNYFRKVIEAKRALAEAVAS